MTRHSQLSTQHLPVPQPRVAINIRPATMDDLPFMDSLQKRNSKALGYFPTKQFEGYIAMGGVLVAEATGSAECSVLSAESESNSLSTRTSALSTRLGYVISRDRYLKRDELGVIYQLCVTPGDQRKLVGASLIQAVFERSAYGCKLYCCWCAQDLAANRFWESLGFVPIAFRGGSEKGLRNADCGLRNVEEGSSASSHPKSAIRNPKSRGPRVHIFWQKRIRRGDTGDVTRGGTPWWFPSKTESGALRADRLVLPIPHGLHWSDPMPVMVQEDCGLQNADCGLKTLASGPRKRKAPSDPSAIPNPKSAIKQSVQFGRPGAPVAIPQAPATEKPAKVRAKAAKIKCDPRLVSAARELRDRWLERVNDPAERLSQGKYDVARLPDPPRAVPAPAMLPAA